MMALFMLVPQLEAAEAGKIALLAPGLEIMLPEPLELSPENIDGTGRYPVIAGKIGGKPAYFISAVSIRGRERNTVLWKKLEMKLRQHSENGGLHLSARGSFTTDEGADVWYRAYEYSDSQQTHRPVYFLLKDDHTAYWINMVFVEGVSKEVAMSLAEALVQRSRIKR